jgi:tetratricopeptide (TPR) repeat protein
VDACVHTCDLLLIKLLSIRIRTMKIVSFATSEQNAWIAQVLFNKGNALYSLGKLDEALACYEKSIAITRAVHDDKPLGHRLYATARFVLLFVVQRVVEIVASTTTTTTTTKKKKKNSNTILHCVGSLLQRLKRKSEATKLFDEAIAVATSVGGLDSLDLAKLHLQVASCQPQKAAKLEHTQHAVR